MTGSTLPLLKNSFQKRTSKVREALECTRHWGKPSWKALNYYFLRGKKAVLTSPTLPRGKEDKGRAGRTPESSYPSTKNFPSGSLNTLKRKNPEIKIPILLQRTIPGPRHKIQQEAPVPFNKSEIKMFIKSASPGSVLGEDPLRRRKHSRGNLSTPPHRVKK